LTGFGLSASAGLNAYIPLLLIGLTAKFFPEVIRLSEPYDMIASPWAIGLLAVLLAVEVLADKVPVVDHLNDAIGLVVRPTAGALLFAASTGAAEVLDPRVSLALGFIVAGAAHGAKATARPVVTATTGGLGNPIVSTLEDFAALLTSAIALMAPLLIAVAMVAFVLLFLWWRGQRGARQGVGAG
jgi:hypothetical protein